MLASPSVHRITDEPLLPLEATSMAATKAGPRAVCPLASAFVNLLSNNS